MAAGSRQAAATAESDAGNNRQQHTEHGMSHAPPTLVVLASCCKRDKGCFSCYVYSCNCRSGRHCCCHSSCHWKHQCAGTTTVCRCESCGRSGDQAATATAVFVFHPRFEESLRGNCGSSDSPCLPAASRIARAAASFGSSPSRTKAAKRPATRNFSFC